MGATAIALAAAGLIAATSSVAVAADGITDMDYLKASRCHGLDASGKLTSIDSKALDAYLASAGKTRSVAVLDLGQKEAAKAKRETRYAEARDRLDAELTGPCMAYMGASNTATASAKSGERTQN